MESPESKKDLLFSITRKDFRVDTFRSGGKGGQNQNKVESGVRITHLESGAVAESREERDQIRNKERAFQKLINTPKFKAWHKVKTSFMLQGIKDGAVELERRVEEAIQPKNLKVEGKDENGRWNKEAIDNGPEKA